MAEITTTQGQQTSPARPVFLTVLCILTFVGSGWGLISSCMQYVGADKNAAMMAAVKEKAMSDVQQATANSSDTAANNLAQSMVSSVVTSFTPEKLKKSALGGIAAAAFCLLGAIMMWGLKKNGYYLYILGTLIGIAVPFMIFGNNILALGASAVMGFFGILFVILYGLNLKHMR